MSRLDLNLSGHNIGVGVTAAIATLVCYDPKDTPSNQ